MTVAKVETKFGTLRTATKFRYVIVAALRTEYGFGAPTAFGYAATVESAMRRVRRYGVGAYAVAVYEVATGQEVTR